MQAKQSLPHALFRLMRPWHYGKNLLVFVPLFFSGQLLHAPDRLFMAFIAFISLCLAASGIYAMNDANDAAEDRMHPQKCNRPVASGRVSRTLAVVMAVALLTASFTLLRAFTFTPPLYVSDWHRPVLVLACYVVLNIAYSILGLKKVPIIDVTIIAFGFVLRILYGASITGVPVSKWLLLTVLMGSYYMALGKRRNELRAAGTQGARTVLKSYTYAFLNQNMYVFLTLTIVFYALWSVDAETAQRYMHSYSVASVPLVVFIAMRYTLDVEGDSDGDPVDVLLHDKQLLVLVLVYLALMSVLIYAGGRIGA